MNGDDTSDFKTDSDYDSEDFKSDNDSFNDASSNELEA